MKVYLCGGMRSGWQDKVIQAFPAVAFLDPRTHGLTDPQAYTAQDLTWLRECDLVFCFLEAANPGGENACFELGYAKALSKPFILVCDRPAERARYWTMITTSAWASVTTLENGLAALGELLTLCAITGTTP